MMEYFQVQRSGHDNGPASCLVPAISNLWTNLEYRCPKRPLYIFTLDYGVYDTCDAQIADYRPVYFGADRQLMAF